MKICYIVGGMPVALLYRPVQPADFVIAADSGFETCRMLGVEPDLVVGDFDSLGHLPEHGNVLRFPVEKDTTDVGLALRAGIEHGYERFMMVGCAGGRPDHTAANYALLAWLARQGMRGVMPGDGFFVTAMTNSTLELPASCRGLVSVFAMGHAAGVTLEGLKYTLKDAVLTDDVPLGISNQFTGTRSRISVQDGTLLLMLEEQAGQDALEQLLA